MKPARLLTFSLALGALIALGPVTPGLAHADPADFDTKDKGPRDSEGRCDLHENPMARLARRWDKLDVNHDGVITREEYLREASERFDLADTNHDGKLTRAEAEAFFRRVAQLHSEVNEKAHAEFQRRLKEGN